MNINTYAGLFLIVTILTLSRSKDISAQINAAADYPLSEMKQSTRATLNRAEKKAVRGCNNWGFFAEFLWVLNHLEWCIRTNQTPIVYWDNRFAYSRGQEYVPGKTNFWEFFFDQSSPLRYQSRGFFLSSGILSR